jgi:hypothetical protein
MPNTLYERYPELLENRPAALQRSQLQDCWFFQVQHMLQRFADAGADRNELVEDTRDWIGIGYGKVADWERHSEEFIRLVRRAGGDPVAAFDADRTVRDLIQVSIDALRRAIDGQLDVDVRDRVGEWQNVLSAVSDIETYVAAMSEPLGVDSPGRVNDCSDGTPAPGGITGSGRTSSQSNELPLPGQAALSESRSIGARPGDAAVAEVTTDSPPTLPTVPVPRLLRNWAQIFAALNSVRAGSKWENDAATRRWLLKLNKEHDGPIIPPPKSGAQATVDEARLLAWVRELGEDFSRRRQEADDRAEAERLTVADRHPYAGTGVVVPEINGSVKFARGSPRTEKVRKGR